MQNINPLKNTFTVLILILALLVLPAINAQAQQDSTVPLRTFSGSLGFSNNGFSIIPSFSFNAPAALTQLSWKWNRFSIDPDFRITPSGKKGSFLLWFRYQLVQQKRFSFRVGVHPAVNWMPAEITENGTVTELLRMRRFLAWELSPSVKINKHLSAGIYYLQGNGLQKNGPQTTHFVTLNATLANLHLGKKVLLSFAPAFFYLNLDKNEGTYFTATTTLGHTHLPFTIHSTINQTIQSGIPGNKIFMWNIGASYHFKRNLKR